MTVTQVTTLPDGSPLLAVELRSDQLCAKVLSFGAGLQDLRLEGHHSPLVLGHANPLNYCSNPAYLGVIVGRVANRISGGQITINGTLHELDKNEQGITTLHGGRDGCSHRNWDVLDRGPAHVTLGHALPDGHMGFPGRLDLTVTYRLQGASLQVEVTACSDASTVCNPAPHFYFNLDGKADIGGHCLQIDSDQVIPTDKGIPVSGPINAETLGFDFTGPRAVPIGLDHHFCFRDASGPLQQMARVYAPGAAMELRSTAPGLQVYDGSGLAIRGDGLIGVSYGPRAGLALEPHCWIDAPNQPWFGQCTLEPGEPMHTKSIFTFDRLD